MKPAATILVDLGATLLQPKNSGSLKVTRQHVYREYIQDTAYRAGVKRGCRCMYSMVAGCL